MKLKRLPETPLFTARELRELREQATPKEEAKEILNEMTRWYYFNIHLITVGEEYAFGNELRALYRYVHGEKTA